MTRRPLLFTAALSISTFAFGPAFAHEACNDGKSVNPAAASCSVPTASAKAFGAPIDEKSQTAQDLRTAIAQLSAKEKQKTQDVLIQAEIQQVCQAKGCWAVLRQGDTEVRMTFKDYAFFLPKDSKGHKVLAQGHLQQKELSEAAARHYLEDAGAPKKQIEKLKGAQKEYSFVASGVRFLD